MLDPDAIEISASIAASPERIIPEGREIFAPENSLREWGIALLLCVLTVIYLRAFYDYVGLTSDEGIVLQGAQRILVGEIPYRDFFSYLTPGSFYWSALLFKIFGSSILVARGALLAYGGAFSLITFLLARRVCSRWNAVLAVVPTVLVCLANQFFELHNWDSTLLALLALYCAVRLLEVPHWVWAAGLGSFTSLTCLFEQSKGAGLVLGLAAGFLTLLARDRSRFPFDRRRLIILALSLAWPFLLILSYFGAHQSLPQMVTCLVWPFHHYSSVNKLPYGYIEGIWQLVHKGSFGWRAFALFTFSPFFVLSALPIFAVGFLAFSASRLSKSCGGGRQGYYVLVSSVICGLLLSTVATGRPDAIHIMYNAPLFCLVLGWMAESARTPFLSTVKTIGLSYVLVSFAALGLAILSTPLAAKFKLETARGIVRTQVPHNSLQLLQSRLLQGERILIYPYNPLFYFLTGTYSMSRYEYFFPGMHGPVESEIMLGELRGRRPRVVLFDPSFRDLVPSICPNVSLQALAAKDPVADYLFTQYRPCHILLSPGTQWRLVFLLRKDLDCSGNPVGSSEQH